MRAGYKSEDTRSKRYPSGLENAHAGENSPVLGGNPSNDRKRVWRATDFTLNVAKEYQVIFGISDAGTGVVVFEASCRKREPSTPIPGRD